MKIQRINQNYKPAFCALKIPSKNGVQNLSTLGKKTLDALDSVGEFIKDTRFYNLYVEKDIYIRDINGMRLNGPYTVQQSDKYLMIGYKEGYTQTRLKLPFDTVKEVEIAKNDIASSSTQIERTAKILKYLDDYKQKLCNKNSDIIINQNDNYETKLEKLINKYGV